MSSDTELQTEPIGTELTTLRAELAERSAEFESAAAGSVIAWAVERFGSHLALACSFQDAVIVDLAVAVDPRIEVVFLDTEAHFPETLEYVEAIRARYDLNLTVTKPVAGAEDFPCGSAQCCEYRKVRPLRQALAGNEAWLTGLKRVDAPTRAATPIVSYDDNWGMVKINPAGHLDRRRHRRLRGRSRHSRATRCCRRDICPSAVPPPPGRWPRARTPGQDGGRAPTRSSADCTPDGEGQGQPLRDAAPGQ